MFFYLMEGESYSDSHVQIGNLTGSGIFDVSYICWITYER